MIKKVFFFALFTVAVSTVWAQYNCKVLVKELEGQYNGECKKGLANGEGVAKGMDSYTGNFKKGYPNGFGVYTYANGSSYIGNFKSGEKDGYGLYRKMVDGSIREEYGLWIANQLVIPNDVKALYRVRDRRGIKMIDPKVKRDSTWQNEVWINFKIDGVPDKTALIQKAEISSGHQIDTRERSLNTLVAFSDIEEFPVTFRLEYQIRQTNHFEMTDCAVEIMLFTKGLWEIDLNH